MKRQLCLLSSVLLALALLIQPMQASFAAPQTSTSGLVFDFTANAAQALWKSGAGTLPFPGTSGDYRGYVLKLDAPVQEDGSLGAPGLLTVPHNKYDGYIQGIYPEFTVQKGDRFQVTVGCEYGAKNCYVTYRLDYINAGGATKIFWSWKEKHEGRAYNANIDLSQLAGQKVRFVLTMLATGYASEDRPLWVAPRIARPGNGLTPMPTLTATATPFDTPPPVLPPGCDRGSFVADVTVRDGATFAPGEAFTKTWRLKNSGYCAWTRDYALVFYGGEQMGAPTLVNLPWPVAPGAMVDVTVNAVAPVAPGQYRSDWMLRNASGGLFGIGSNGDKPFWMLINVVGAPPLAETGYDFAANLCAAEWRSGAGILTCPFTDGDSRGFALPAPVRLEDGSMASSAILTHPQNKYDGYIQATFPTFTVQPGDRFQAVVGCEHNISCYVTFRLEYLTAGGAPRIFWKWSEKNEGKTYRVDLDLSPLAGQSLRFVLTSLAAGPATNDRAVWAEPRIIRPGIPPPTRTPTPIPTSSPTPTETPVPVFISPYAVIGIHPEGALNLYAAPGAENPIVGSFLADTRNIERGSAFVTVGSDRWVEARIPGGVTGWVRDASLTEYIAPERFVTDSRPIQRIEQLKQAMNNSDGNLFASLVSPKRGVQILYHGTWGSNPVIYTSESARQAFTSADVIDWGTEGASGINAVGTFAEKVQPKLQDVLNSAYELHPNDPNRASMYVEPWPGGYQNFNYFAVLKPSTPSIELDWRLWLAGFEYVDGVPYLTLLLHYVWEP